MNDGVSTTRITNGSLQCGAFGLAALVISGAILVRMGYNLGLSHAKKLLKQHDKDTRRMYKREKQIYKEQRRKEKMGEGT